LTVSKLTRAKKLVGKKIISDFGEDIPLRILDAKFLDLNTLQAINNDEHGWVFGWPEKDKNGALYLQLEHTQEFSDATSWHKVNSRVKYKIVE